jgi:Zn2+/Cd2+-exporting ATPase
MDTKILPKEADCCGADACAQSVPNPDGASHAAPGRRFRIATMDCSVEEGEIRRALECVPGIRSLNFQLSTRTLTINAEQASYPAALDAIRQAGFAPESMEVDAGTPARHGHAHDHARVPSDGIARLALGLVLAMAAELASWFASPDAPWQLLGMGLALAAIWLAGIDVYKKGIAAFFLKKLNINALMAVAVSGAFLIGQWPEAAMVMALYAIAELIEARAVDRARNAIQGLLALAPEEALVCAPDGNWRLTPAADVPLGALVRVRPGERVALDGFVVRGTGAVNQASVTGESIPVDKAPGDPVFAGTINETGELEFRVTAAAGNTTLARIIHAVEQAQSKRAPTQRFVDRFAAIYTPAVFFIALAVALLAPLLLGITWVEAIYKALVLLVIACPCALVISTPVTVVSGLAAGARRGILIKGGTYLESARLLRAVALDKTGTVTEGKPRLVDWRPWGGADEAQVPQLAASLASRSDHPVSQAIAAGVGGQLLPVEAFTALPGRGVSGTIAGEAYLLGNHRWVHERDLCDPALEVELRAHEQQGRTVTLLAHDNRALAIFAVADTIRESSRQAIGELRALGVVPVMLTGDNTATAQAIAHQARIDDVRGDLLPQAKLDAIKELQKRHGATGMAGDGINDAPALAQADIGFAMGGAGTHVAMEAADVVIMNDNLRRVAETVRLSRRTHAVLWQNIMLALGIKAVFLLLAVFGNATMWMAVFADMGASLLVVGNGLRLLNGARHSAAPAVLSARFGHAHAH